MLVYTAIVGRRARRRSSGIAGDDQFGETIVRKLITEISAQSARRLAGTE